MRGLWEEGGAIRWKATEYLPESSRVLQATGHVLAFSFGLFRQLSLDVFTRSDHANLMTSRELSKLLKAHGCELQRHGKGSHEVWRCPGGCQTIIPSHRGDIPAGTLRAIGRQLEECLGKDWWKK